MIKNYTSTVPANRSVLHIEEQLIKHGATEVLKWYEDFKLVGVAFFIKTGESSTPFRLPANVEKVEKYLSGGSRLTQIQKERIHAQAERTAWKLLSDAIDIQMSQVDLEQTELSQAFMGYIYNHAKKETLFDQWKEKGFALLEDKSGGK